MQPGGSNDTYRGSSVNGFSHFPTDPLGTGAPPPWRSPNEAGGDAQQADEHVDNRVDSQDHGFRIV